MLNIFEPPVLHFTPWETLCTHSGPTRFWGGALARSVQWHSLGCWQWRISPVISARFQNPGGSGSLVHVLILMAPSGEKSSDGGHIFLGGTEGFIQQPSPHTSSHRYHTHACETLSAGAEFLLLSFYLSPQGWSNWLWYSLSIVSYVPITTLLLRFSYNWSVGASWTQSPIAKSNVRFAKFLKCSQGLLTLVLWFRWVDYIASSWVWWNIQSPALGSLRQEDCEFKDSLGYRAGYRPACTT
jgi:hypothetical protein